MSRSDAYALPMAIVYKSVACMASRTGGQAGKTGSDRTAFAYWFAAAPGLHEQKLNPGANSYKGGY